MEWGTFSKVLGELKLYGGEVNTVVLYHGGEPLLNPDLDEMINRIKQTEVGKVKIVTNGKILEEAWSIRLIDSGLDEIEISMDSTSIAGSNLVRRRSNSSQTIQNIKLLENLSRERDSDLRVSISTTQFVDEYDIDTIDMLTKARTPIWLQEIFPHMQIKSTWAVQWPGGFPLESKVAFMARVEQLPTTCSLLEETITVRSNGDVVVCCYDLIGLSNLGNVHSLTLSNIWNSAQYANFRYEFARKNYREPCSSCAVVTGSKYLKRSELLLIEG